MGAATPRHAGDGGLSHDQAYFEGQYARDPDPWGFDTRWYERRKYALTMAALPDQRYRVAVEPGCANGALTELLAERCDRVVAFDTVGAAVARARQRLAVRSHVTVLERSFPEYWPDEPVDLVVWSEVAYYLTDAGLAAARHGVDAGLVPGGVLIAVHYTGVTDYPRPGREVARWIDGFGFLDRVTSLRDADFELVVWRRTLPAEPRHG